MVRGLVTACLSGGSGTSGTLFLPSQAFAAAKHSLLAGVALEVSSNRMVHLAVMAIGWEKRVPEIMQLAGL